MVVTECKLVSALEREIERETHTHTHTVHIYVPDVNILAETVLRTVLALEANLSVPSVSFSASDEGDTLAMSTVLLLPPSESLRRKVSALSR